MGPSEFIDRYGEPLPSSIVTVIEAVRALEDALDSRGDGPCFPDLRTAPPSDSGVETAIRAAAKWAKHVRQLAGVGERQRAYGRRGVLPMFGPRPNFSDAELPTKWLGEVPKHLLDDPEVYFYFERAFHATEEPVQGSARALREPTLRGVAFTVSNWSRLRMLLDHGYVQVRGRAQGITEWVLAQIYACFAWAPPNSARGTLRRQGDVHAPAQVASARRALDDWTGEWVPRRRLRDLGIPDTSVDQHFKTDPDRFREDKRVHGSRGEVEYRKSFLLEFVRSVWQPRDRT